MAGDRLINPDALQGASASLDALAPDANDIPPPVTDEAEAAASANDGYLTGTAGKNLAEQFKPVMQAARERVKSHADSIAESAEAWVDIDRAIEEGFRAYENDLGRDVV